MNTMLHLKCCKAFEEGSHHLTDAALNDLLAQVPSWIIERDNVHRLKNSFLFDSIFEAHAFANCVAIIAKDERQHPAVRIHDNSVCVEFSKPAVHGLSINDFIMAAKVNTLLP